MNNKKIRKTGVFFLFALMLFATVLLHAAPKEWTFMIYMAGDNNLENVAMRNINQLEKVGSTNAVNFVVQADRSGSYSSNVQGGWTGARRYYIHKDSDFEKITSPVLQDLGNTNMADPKVLVDFVAWAKQNYPAKRYALIIWNHGTGWKAIPQNRTVGSSVQSSNNRFISDPLAATLKKSVQEVDVNSINGLSHRQNNYSYGNSGMQIDVAQNIAYDDTSGTSMDLPSLQGALSEIHKILGQKLDIIGFDACLMQMAEVGHLASPHALYQVAAPDLEPERGWSYDVIAAKIASSPEIGSGAVAAFICDAFAKSYSNGSQGNTAVALSALNLSRAGQFNAALNAFASTAAKNISDIEKYEKARESSLKYSYTDYLDLCHFLTLLLKSDVAKDTQAAARNLLVATCGTKEQPGYVMKLAVNSPKFQESRGLSIFFPTRQGFRTHGEAYRSLSFARQTAWYSFLNEISSPRVSYLQIADVVAKDANNDGKFAPGETFTISLLIRNTGQQKAASAEAVIDSSSPYVMPKQAKANFTSLPLPGKQSLLQAFKLKIADNAPVNTEVPFKLTLSSQGMPASTLELGLTVQKGFEASGNMLLVLTDASTKSANVLKQMLQKNGAVPDIWDRMEDGEIRSEVLARYLNGWVLVSLQDSATEEGLTNSEVAVLDSFLGKGGRLLLNGQDMAFALRDHPFFPKRVKAKFVQDDVNVRVVTGVNFMGGQNITIFGGNGANNQKWPDEIDPMSGAKVLFKYNESARLMDDEIEMEHRVLKPGSASRGVVSKGAAAVSVTSGYKLMFFAFNIEAISTDVHRDGLMKEIVAFMKPNVAGELSNYAACVAEKIEPNMLDSYEDLLLEKTMMIENLEARILRQVKYDLQHKPGFDIELKQTIDDFSASASRDHVSGLVRKIRAILR